MQKKKLRNLTKTYDLLNLVLVNLVMTSVAANGNIVDRHIENATNELEYAQHLLKKEIKKTDSAGKQNQSKN